MDLGGFSFDADGLGEIVVFFYDGVSARLQKDVQYLLRDLLLLALMRLLGRYRISFYRLLVLEYGTAGSSP